MQTSILPLSTNLCRTVQLKTNQKTLQVLHGSISACPQRDVAKLHPITIRNPIKQSFTKFHTGGVPPIFFEKFQFRLKPDTNNAHVVYNDLHTCFSARISRVTCYISVSIITFSSQAAEIQVTYFNLHKRLSISQNTWFEKQLN